MEFHSHDTQSIMRPFQNLKSWHLEVSKHLDVRWEVVQADIQLTFLLFTVRLSLKEIRKEALEKKNGNLGCLLLWCFFPAPISLGNKTKAKPKQTKAQQKPKEPKLLRVTEGLVPPLGSDRKKNNKDNYGGTLCRRHVFSIGHPVTCRGKDRHLQVKDKETEVQQNLGDIRKNSSLFLGFHASPPSPFLSSTVCLLAAWTSLHWGISVKYQYTYRTCLY